MFSEILKIIPVISPGDGKKMEKSLSERFGKVASRFGSGLKAVIKGSIIGISLGLLNRLLNPLEALEDRIKSLLGQGSDARDLADRFNSTPGQVQRLQDVAEIAGVKPDQLQEMMVKFAQAVETAREELSTKGSDISPSTNAVQDFIGQKDMVESFIAFLTRLRAEGQSPGRDVTYNGQFLKHQSGMDSRKAIEKEVLGEVQFGGMKRLIETDLAEKLGGLKGAFDTNQLNETLTSLASMEDKRRALEVASRTQSLIDATNKISDNTVKQMEAATAREQQRLDSQLQGFNDLRRAANGIETLKEGLTGLSLSVTKALGYLGNIAERLNKVGDSKIFRNWLWGDK